MTTMLSIVQQATAEMGLAVPTFVAGNSSLDVVQQLALLNAVGYELQRQFDWQALQKVNIFTVAIASITGTVTLGSANLVNASSITGIDSTYQITGLGMNQATYVSATPSGNTIPLTQPATGSYVAASYSLTKVKYNMPSDYDRQIDNTHWDKSKHWRMQGPLSPQQWEVLTSGYISTGPRINYRIFGGYFQIWPAVGVNEVLGFEYVSNGWSSSAAGAAQTSLIADTDTCIFPDRLMVLGLKKKYFEIKQFDSSVFERDFRMELGLAKTNDAGSANLSMISGQSTMLIGWDNIPDSGYGR